MKKNWKKVIKYGAFGSIAVVLTVLIIIVTITSFKAKKEDLKQSLVLLDNEPVRVYSSIEEANSNSIMSSNINRSLTVLNNDIKVNGNFTSLGNIPSWGVITNDTNGNYTLKLSVLKIKTNLLLEFVKIDASTSQSYRRLCGYDKAEKYYLSLTITPTEDNDTLDINDILPSVTQTTSTDDQKPPTGNVLVNGNEYTYYTDSKEARNHPILLEDTILQNGISFTGKPDEGVMSIYIEPRFLDDEKIYREQVKLISENNWSEVLDVSKYSGHKVTLEVRYVPFTLIQKDNHFYVTFIIP
jgi:hypothetical protein